jgi:phage gp16-like protein
MPIDRTKIALLHVGKARLGMDDDAWRSMLRRAAGVSSSTDLDDAGFDLVMQEFRRLGFISTAAARNFGERRGMASDEQVYLIRKLWAEYTAGEGTDASLGHWLERTFKVSALKFLDDRRASRAIDALRAMVARRSSEKASPHATP